MATCPIPTLPIAAVAHVDARPFELEPADFRVLAFNRFAGLAHPVVDHEVVDAHRDQPETVHERQGIPQRVCIYIQVPDEADPVRLQVPAELRIIIPEVVVVQAAFAVMILAGKSVSLLGPACPFLFNFASRCSAVGE